MDAWTIRDFEPEDLEAVVRMDSSSTTTDQLPLFALSDVVGSLLNRHPAVVATRTGTSSGRRSLASTRTAPGSCGSPSIPNGVGRGSAAPCCRSSSTGSSPEECDG